MKKFITVLGIVIVAVLLYLVFIPSGIYIKPQVKSQVTAFAKAPDNKNVEATPQVRQALKNLNNPKVTNISDPEGGTETSNNFSFGINGKTYSAEMDKVGTFSWKLVKLY